MGDDGDLVLAAADERLGLLGLDRVEDDDVRRCRPAPRRPGDACVPAVTAGVVDADRALLAGRLDAGLEGLDVDAGRAARGRVGDEQGEDGGVLAGAAGEQAAAEQQGEEEGGEGAHRGNRMRPLTGGRGPISLDRWTCGPDATRSRSSRRAAAPRR